MVQGGSCWKNVQQLNRYVLLLCAKKCSAPLNLPCNLKNIGSITGHLKQEVAGDLTIFYDIGA
jgi:hypothetical protein